MVSITTLLDIQHGEGLLTVTANSCRLYPSGVLRFGTSSSMHARVLWLL